MKKVAYRCMKWSSALLTAWRKENESNERLPHHRLKHTRTLLGALLLRTFIVSHWLRYFTRKQSILNLCYHGIKGTTTQHRGQV